MVEQDTTDIVIEKNNHIRMVEHKAARGRMSQASREKNALESMIYPTTRHLPVQEGGFS